MGVDERPLLQAESMPGEGEGRNQGIQSFQFSQDANEGGSELGCQPEVVVLEEGCPGEEEGEEAKEEEVSVFCASRPLARRRWEGGRAGGREGQISGTVACRTGESCGRDERR